MSALKTTLITGAVTPFPGSAFSSPLYRIPALAVTASGRILIAYDVREDWRDLPADFDIALRSSDDGGATWSQPTTLRAHTPGHGFGDASLTYHAPSDTLLCWYVGSTGESYFSASPDGEGLELWLARSTDGGETWEHTDYSHLRPAGVAGMFGSSGTGTVLDDGTLLQTFVARIANRDYALVARSTDAGLTWQVGQPIGPACDENKTVGLGGNRVLLHARDRGARRQAYSQDGGITFEEPQTHAALVEPGCNGGLIRAGGLLIASLCSDPAERRNLSLHISTDEGRSWSAPIPVDEGAAAYSTMALLGQDTLALAWEADDYTTIRYASIPLTQLGIGPDGSFNPEAVTLLARPLEPGAATSAKPPVVNATLN